MYSLVAEYVKARYQCFSEVKYIGSNSSAGIHFVGRESVVSIATRYGLDGPGMEYRWGARFFAPVWTGPGVHPASYTMRTAFFLPVGKGDRGLALTTHPYRSPRLKKE